MVRAEEVVAATHNAYSGGITQPFEFRIKQLKALQKLLDEKEEILADAIIKDIRKPKFEAILYEIGFVKNELKETIHYLKQWMAPRHQEKPLPFLLDKVFLQPEPYGNVLIIGAWNYPLQLLIGPLIGAIAAGNTVILKPSEMAPHTAKLLEEILPSYIESDCYKVFNGGIPETTELLEQRFDYIFYTGNCAVGRIVQKAASKHLTPVTLELGGKSPVFIDSTVDIDIVAPRILFGRFANAGQSCISPDYVLCNRDIEKKLVESCKKVIKKWYGDDVKSSPDFGRIINERHFGRIIKLLEGVKIAVGGNHDSKDLFIEPTIVTDVRPGDAIMQEEIFGPILPILNVDSALEAVRYIKAREKPLALYIFSNNKDTQDVFLKNTSSGNVTVNDTMMHFSCTTIPFGGVGNSGMGTYHGRYTFDTFSHMKGTLVKGCGKLDEYVNTVRYPPYTDGKMKIVRAATAARPPIPGLKYIPHLLIFGLGVIATIAGDCLYRYFDSKYNNKS